MAQSRISGFFAMKNDVLPYQEQPGTLKSLVSREGIEPSTP